MNRVQVVPLTSNDARLYPSEAYVDVGGERRKAMADQLIRITPLTKSVPEPTLGASGQAAEGGSP